MKKDALRISLLLLILIGINVVVTSKNCHCKITKSSYGGYRHSHINLDDNWEYIKKRLFPINGEKEFSYKSTERSTKGPILINLQGANYFDSLAVDYIIKELRVIIPYKTIDYFENVTGMTFENFRRQAFESFNIGEHQDTLVNGYHSQDLMHSTIKLKFGVRNDVGSYIDNITKTTLPDGSTIERTAPSKKSYYEITQRNVWFHLKNSLPYDKREHYIKYELLRSLCFIYPHYTSKTLNKGVFFTDSYIPDIAEFNNKDKFLLQKLYEDDFLKQFRDYLSATYSWNYANNFLNKDLTRLMAWAVIILMSFVVFLVSFSLLRGKKFKYSYLNYFLPILFISLYATNFIVLYEYLTNMINFHLYIDNPQATLYFSLLRASGLAIIVSFVLWLIEKMWINTIKQFSFQLIYKVVFTFILLNTLTGILFVIRLNDIDFLIYYMRIFIFTFILTIGRGLLIYLNHFSESLVKEKDVELSRLKEINAQSELKLLQSHINPHFLYNALNSIAGLAHNSPDKTEKMALSLSNLFRYSINKKGQKMSTVKEEVLMVQNYLDIEKIRFGDRLKFTLQVDKALENEQIPMYILQPLVENAIKHGISKIRGEGLIILKIKKELDNLIILVSDNGPDYPSGLVSGHGLQTVYDLLRLSYGDKASLKWENTPVKQISILIVKV